MGRWVAAGDFTLSKLVTGFDIVPDGDSLEGRIALSGRMLDATGHVTATGFVLTGALRESPLTITGRLEDGRIRATITTPGLAEPVEATFERVGQSSAVSPVSRQRAYVNYPAPAYLPAGFRFLKEQEQPVDGFHGTIPFGRDIEQVALLYEGPTDPRAGGQMRFPISFIATRSHGHRLGGTERREGVADTIRFTDGTETTATYWDGMWAPPRVYDSAGTAVPPPRGTAPVWSRENFHAIVYRWRDYTIGIRASRLNGVSREELLRIAASTTVPR